MDRGRREDGKIIVIIIVALFILANLEKDKYSGMDFYYLGGSPPCRAVLMVAKALNVKLNKRLLQLHEGEHLKPEFLKLNPQHTIPTLVDNGFVIWDSHAIVMYLADKYGKNDTFYPKDLQKRAIVNQRLFFNVDVIYKSFSEYFRHVLFADGPPNPEKLQMMDDAFNFLNTFLTDHYYVAGDNLTIADLVILSTVSTIDFSGYDFKRFTHVHTWYERLKDTVPGWQENYAGLLEYEAYVIERKSNKNFKDVAHD